MEAVTNNQHQGGVRIAEDRDLDRIAAVLGSAFTHDPVLNWFGAGPQIQEMFFRAEIETLYRPHGIMHLTQDGYGAALWLPPEAPHQSGLSWRLLRAGWKLFRKSGLEGLKRGQTLAEQLSKHRPQRPHFYLHAIGAHLDHQGQGLGSALLRAGLKVCDQSGMPAYLESTNPLNPPLYRRFGFEVTQQLELPEKGPVIDLMYRNPRSP